MDLALLWKKGNFTPPRVLKAQISVPLVDENGEYSETQSTLLVIEDSSDIYTLMDEEGNVYYLTSARCQLGSNGKEYACTGPFYYSPFAEDNEKLFFARREILPLYFGAKSLT